MKARRYNQGKLRWSLLPVRAMEKVVEVYTKGAHKYTIYYDEEGNEVLGSDVPYNFPGLTIVDDGANNWKKGLPFTNLLDSCKRHIAEYEKRTEIDEDLGTHHLANAIWNLLTLIEGERRFPHLDDREWNLPPKIGYDLDGVLTDFETHFRKWFNIPEEHELLHWNDPYFRIHFNEIVDDEDFWLSIPVLEGPERMIWEPTMYVTSRPISSVITQKWLDKNNFPQAELVTVGVMNPKVDALKGKVDFFIDDGYHNFIELNKAGIPCYLRTREHNKKYNVSGYRVENLNEFYNKIS